jgi:hypothetical protein
MKERADDDARRSTGPLDGDVPSKVARDGRDGHCQGVRFATSRESGEHSPITRHSALVTSDELRPHPLLSLLTPSPGLGELRRRYGVSSTCTGETRVSLTLSAYQRSSGATPNT